MKPSNIYLGNFLINFNVSLILLKSVNTETPQNLQGFFIARLSGGLKKVVDKNHLVMLENF